MATDNLETLEATTPAPTPLAPITDDVPKVSDGAPPIPSIKETNGMPAYAIADSVKQTAETRDYFDTFIKYNREYIGPDANIKALASAYKQGTLFIDPDEPTVKAVVDVSRFVKYTSDRSKWQLTLVQDLDDGGGGGGTGDDDGIISQLWSQNMTQYQFPLEKYLKPEEAQVVALWDASNPWVKMFGKYETAEYDFVKVKPEGAEIENETLEVVQDNVIKELSATSELARKIAFMKWCGNDYVMRFYPQATLVTTYRRYHHAHTREKSLGCMDIYPNRQFHQEKHFKWLKTAFDWQENPDKTWTLTESWIASPIEDGGWNRNLYGEDSMDTTKWKFYDPTVPEIPSPPKNKYAK